MIVMRERAGESFGGGAATAAADRLPRAVDAAFLEWRMDGSAKMFSDPSWTCKNV